MTIQDLGILLIKRDKKLAVNFSEGQYHAYAFGKAGELSAYGRGDNFEQAVERLVEKVQ